MSNNGRISENGFRIFDLPNHQLSAPNYKGNLISQKKIRDPNNCGAILDAKVETWTCETSEHSFRLVYRILSVQVKEKYVSSLIQKFKSGNAYSFTEYTQMRFMRTQTQN